MDSVTPKQADFQLETPAKDVLLPERHPQHDLFVCDVADAVLKDDMASMEHPFYSLSKKPETNVRRYEQGCKWLEVVPSVKGLATIYDKDILIYCWMKITHVPFHAIHVCKWFDAPVTFVNLLEFLILGFRVVFSRHQ